MTRADWLADVLKSAGLTVVELDGWRRRGRDMRTIDAVILHDTVTPPSWPDSRTATMLRDGHANLSGPLSQLGLDRQGRLWVVAAGRCNHNGYGLYGNDTIGIETFANGGGHPNEPWNTAQQDAAARASAAICRHLDLPVTRVLGHKESDPSRKVDPYGTDLAAVRRRITELLSPVDPFEEWWMSLTDTQRANLEALASTIGPGKLEQLDALADTLRAEGTNGRSFVRQLLAFHRDERPTLQEIIRHIEAKDTSVQGLVRGATNLFRAAHRDYDVDTQ